MGRGGVSTPIDNTTERKSIMALYKYQQIVSHSEDGAFDELHPPGSSTPHSGIYRCEVCGHEIVSTQGHPLPPQNHHQHPQHQTIKWRLIVAHASK